LLHSAQSPTAPQLDAGHTDHSRSEGADRLLLAAATPVTYPYRMQTGVHCVAATDWFSPKRNGLVPIPFVDTYEENGGTVVGNVVTDRCVMDDDIYDALRGYMTPGAVLQECNDATGRGLTVIDILLPARRIEPHDEPTPAT